MKLLVIVLLLCVIFVTIANGRIRVSSRGRSRGRSSGGWKPSRKVVSYPTSHAKHVPHRTHIPHQLHKPVIREDKVNKLLDVDIASLGINKNPHGTRDQGQNYDLGFESIKKLMKLLEEPNFGKVNKKVSLKSANPNPVGLEHLTPAKHGQTGNTIPGGHPNLGPYPGQYAPSAPPMPGSYPSQHNVGQYPSYPQQGQQNLQYALSAPPMPGSYPSQQNSKNPNPGQFPSYTYPTQNNYPIYSNPFSQNYPAYPNQQLNSKGQSNIGIPKFYSIHQNLFQNPHYPVSNLPFYSNTGFFGTSNNNYGSFYSPYPGYSGIYGNSFLPKPYSPSFPIPTPIPIPISTSWDDNDYDYKVVNKLIKEVIKKIDDLNKNKTSVFVVNNSTVAPCNTDEFKYHGGTVNVTVTTCTMLNCTAVSITTVLDKEGEIVENKGVITMCLSPNTKVSTSYSGSAHPEVSEFSSYWKMLCIDQAPFNGTNIAQNTSVNHFVKNNGQNTSNINATSTENLQLGPSERATENLQLGTSERAFFYPNVNTNQTTNINAKHNGSSVLQNSTVTNNFPMPTNRSQELCEIMDCSSTLFCMPTMEVTCTDALNMTSYTSCVRIKMCKSPSTPFDRAVTLNTKIEKHNITTNNLTETNDLRNLTVITYFPPILPTFGNFSNGNSTNSNCTMTPFQPDCSLTGAYANNTVNLPGNVALFDNTTTTKQNLI